jgi:hypothetical protein
MINMPNRRRPGRPSQPLTFCQGFVAGMVGLATFNLDVRMLPRQSIGPSAIAAVLLVALSSLPGEALSPSGALSFIAGAIASAHMSTRHAPRGSYVHLWLLAGILAETWVRLGAWAGLLQDVVPQAKPLLVMVISTVFWAVGSAKVRRVALAVGRRGGPLS